MSANRSVQAAQRRRAGPPETGPRSQFPQTSINSAQLFANQARSGSGPNIPSGRLAGQHAALQQQQAQQQMLSKDPKDKLSSVNKMTINQAITLITLRLGAIETKMMNGDRPEMMGSAENTEIINTIMDRLNDLENRSIPSGSNSNSVSGSSLSVELALLKQQVDAMSKQPKGTKEVTALKNQIVELQNELTQTKDLLNVLQNVVLENSQKILELSIPIESEEYEEQNEIVGNDLKEMIEQELNVEDN